MPRILTVISPLPTSMRIKRRRETSSMVTIVEMILRMMNRAIGSLLYLFAWTLTDSKLVGAGLKRCDDAVVVSA
jgi:hypothetical protein